MARLPKYSTLNGTRIPSRIAWILLDRLESPDALAEVFEENHTQEAVYAACDTLVRVLTGRMLLGRPLTLCEADCLADAVEGSTVLAPYWGDRGSSQRRTVERQLRDSARLVEEIIGRRLEVPDC